MILTLVFAQTGAEEILGGVDRNEVSRNASRDATDIPLGIKP
jgi:hypothetical protein